MSEDDPRFPIGTPVGHVDKKRPVPGRPGWFYGPKDVPYYVEPERKQDEPLMLPRLAPAVLHAAAAVLRWRAER